MQFTDHQPDVGDAKVQGLGTLLAGGLQSPDIWWFGPEKLPNYPKFSAPSAQNIKEILYKRKVRGVEASFVEAWGRPKTGLWDLKSLKNTPKWESPNLASDWL